MSAVTRSVATGVVTYGTSVKTIHQYLLDIFATTEGGLYDAYLPTLWDTSTGVAQVDAAEDPLGLWADRRLGMVLGPELWSDGAAAFAGESSRVSPNVYRIYSSAGVFSDVHITGLTAGKTYKIRFTVDSITTLGGGVVVDLTGAPIFTTTGLKTCTVVAITSSLSIKRGAGVTDIQISGVTAKLIDGNHLSQSTAAARPTYRVDAGGRPYVAWLGTDDNLTSPTGGGGSAGFFFCAAIRPTGGAGTVRRLFSDAGANTGYVCTLNASNVFTLNAGNGVAYTQATGAAGTVGTDYVVMFWDDGTNLNVQINNGAVTAVARPVVVAGTTGFTIGKDNGAASSFLIADVYHMCWAKDTGLTAAQRETEKRNAASKIGLIL